MGVDMEFNGTGSIGLPFIRDPIHGGSNVIARGRLPSEMHATPLGLDTKYDT